MRVAALVEPGRFEIQDRPAPVPRPHEVVIDVRAAGICGTDLAVFAGDYRVPLPLVPGHEFCGVISEIGVGVPEKWSGAYVTSEINVTCLTRKDPEPCYACRRHLSHHCMNRQVLGLKGADGAFAERIVVPVGGVHRLPASLPAPSAVLIEPLAAAIQTFEVTPITPGELVVVLGAGRLGLLVCRVARSYGARVVAFSRSADKRDRALLFGAQESFDPGEPMGWESLMERSRGLGADVVVECTGQPDGLTRALSLVRPRGTVALKTTCGKYAEQLSATDIVVREITVQGSRCGPFPEAIERLAAGQVPVEEILADSFPLAEVEAAFAAAHSGAKVILIPSA
jgi:threonine dehydrogenase-like Zn-dependent dehydrogenase